MRRLPRKIKAKIFRFYDWFPFSNPNVVVFVVKNRTYFSGNLRVALDVVLKNTSKKVIVYKDGKCHPQIKLDLEKKGVKVIENFSFKAIFYLVTSRYFIFSHAPRDAHLTRYCKKRTVVNLWHGSIFKNVELLIPRLDNKKKQQILNNVNLYDGLIASSEIDKKMMVKAFGVPADKVGITGLPRYSMLTKDYLYDDCFLKLQQTKIDKIKQNKRLILYAPTFREKEESPIQSISSSDWLSINKWCEQNDMVFGVRAHPYDESRLLELNNLNNVVVINQRQFTETNLVLRNTDFLVVDYSSIWIDFLLLKKPILGYSKDYDEYFSRERGFAYDFKKVFPSTFNQSVPALLQSLTDCLTHENYEYKSQLKIFHKYSLENTDYETNLLLFLSNKFKN